MLGDNYVDNGIGAGSLLEMTVKNTGAALMKQIGDEAEAITSKRDTFLGVTNQMVGKDATKWHCYHVRTLCLENKDHTLIKLKKPIWKPL